MTTGLFTDEPRVFVQPLPSLVHTYRIRNLDTGEVAEVRAPCYEIASDAALGLWGLTARVACWEVQIVP